MRPRNFSNFIESYLDLHYNPAVPEKFQRWMAYTVLAGAIERKLWCQIDDGVIIYPNLYVMLVARPGVGKSTAIDPATALLRRLEETGQKIHFMPKQVTEAKVIEMMQHRQGFEVNGKLVQYCAGFYAAPEASSSLKDIYGGFTDMLTEFYDCPRFFSRATMGRGELKLENVCFNVVTGCTFDHLGKLVTTSNIQGGFASRFIYVIDTDKKERAFKWKRKGERKEKQDITPLLDDLTQIAKLYGEFTPTDEVIEMWPQLTLQHDKEMNELDNESLQTVLVRKMTNLVKIAMLESIAESNSLMLEAHHLEKALSLLNSMQEDLPNMITTANATRTDTQMGLNAALKLELMYGPKAKSTVCGNLVNQRNYKPNEVQATIMYLVSSGVMYETNGKVGFVDQK